ncbi:MAG: thioredoxin family protein [Deltaproteobacteria bacterium]|nr:thioredoxin family protein [Deltaproteobacteria bacterium]
MNTTLEERNDELRRWGGALAGPVDIGLVRSTDRRTEPFAAFCEALHRAVPAVGVYEEEAEGDRLPAIRIGDSWTFHMVPEAKELAPFLDLLARVAAGDPGLPAGLAEKLRAVNVPSLIDLYVTTQCPNCPAVMNRIASFPLVNARIALRIVDGLLFPEMARKQAVRAVPTVLLSDGIRFTGQVRAEEVADGLLNGDPAQMGAEAFARMIHAGDAEGLAGMMIERGQVFPGVLDLVAGDLFSLRLGAMVAMETIGEQAPELALKALEPLWNRMEGADLSARGDIAYLIGELGDESWRPRLETLLTQTPEPELQDAIRDALESLEAGGGGGH